MRHRKRRQQRVPVFDMKRIEIQPGERFGRWTIISFSGKVTKRKMRLFECVCDCGTQGLISIGDLRSGHSKSCGCLKKDVTTDRNITHGLCLDPINKHLLNVWRNMMDRCYRQTHKHYKNWGGRGISVCEEWHDANQFVEWGRCNGYAPNLTIDRINNDGNYEPTNCRWATKKEQGNNRRDCRMIMFNGETKTVTEWSEIVGIDSAAIRHRIKAGWSTEKALTVPSQRQQQ
jgi:hypothetical protein